MRAVISDIRQASISGNSVSFATDVRSFTDYYAFGGEIAGRKFNTSDYRFGFNGKENDPETGFQDYGMRGYNPQLCRFFRVDPIASQYPELTPYQFASNTPIQAIDLDGLERYHYSLLGFDDCGEPILNQVGVEDIKTTHWHWSWNAPFVSKETKVNDHVEAFVHTQHFYEGTIEYFSQVEFTSTEAVLEFSSKDAAFNGTTPDAIDSELDKIRFWHYVQKGLANVGEEGRVGHVGGATKPRVSGKKVSRIAGAETPSAPKVSVANSQNSANPLRSSSVPNNGLAPKHGGTEHNRRIDKVVKILGNDPDVRNIRKNQVQTDVSGNRVGNNRPDVQYDKIDSKTNQWIHFNIEWDTRKSSSNKHSTQIPANDPNASNKFFIIRK